MDVEAICSGWLTKSPSSKYVTLFSRGKISIRVPLKSKWHRRYFVLHKPHGSLPHQFAFDYFKDEHDHRRRGTINLEECEKILSELDSSHYPHLFSIKTKSRDKDRVYYLAAETEEDMLRWVKCLCSLCDLKMGPMSPDSTSSENHTVAPNPPVRHDSMQLTVDVSTQKVSADQSLANEELSNEILEEIEAIKQGRLDVDTRPVNDRVPSGYTELVECTTGESQLPGNNAEFIELYDVPKPQQRLAPPTRLLGQSQSVRRPNKPPADSIKASRSANSSPRFARTLPNTRLNPSEHVVPPRPPKQSQAPEEIYQNIPTNSPVMSGPSHASPNFLRINSHTNSNDAFTYSLSPNSSVSNSPSANRRTNQIEGHVSPSRNFSVDSLYHNTASLSCYTDGANSEAVAQSRQQIDSLYDIPKSLNVSAAIPPPPQCPGGVEQAVVHKYVNASAGIIPKATNAGETQQTSPLLSDSPSPTGLGEVELDRQIVVDNHYDLSPGNGVRDKPTRPPKPRILSDPTALDGTEEQASHSVLQVSKSFRTREYTKDSVFSDSEESSRTNAQQEIKLPSRINTHDSTSSSSSDEEDDDDEETYAVPPAPRPLQQQPVLPERLHHKTLGHAVTADHLLAGGDSYHNQSNVKRSSSMSKVPVPPGGASKLTTQGNPSPKLKNNQHTALRSERSSTVCATDWRNKPIGSNAMGLQVQQKMPRPSIRLMEPVRDIQYVELDQSGDRGEPSPKPTRPSLSNTIPVGGQSQSNAQDTLEYTDIDLVKTLALSETRKEREITKEQEIRKEQDFRKRSENLD